MKSQLTVVGLVKNKRLLPPLCLLKPMPHFNSILSLFQEVSEFARPEGLSNESVFSEVYHALIHSPALETLLNLEHTYAISVEDVVSQRDRDMAHLGERYASGTMEGGQSLC